MDAIEYLRIKNRICENFPRCVECPFHSSNTGSEDSCELFSMRNPQKAVDIVERWRAEHLAETRQGELMKIFPTLKIGNDGVVNFCPQPFDNSVPCYLNKTGCEECRRKFWLETVGENSEE